MPTEPRSGISPYPALLTLLVTSALFIGFHAYTNRRHQLESATGDLARLSGLIRQIVELERQRLGDVARVILNGPVLQGALRTGHAPTAEAALEELARSNRIAEIEVAYRGSTFRVGGVTGGRIGGMAEGELGGEVVRTKVVGRITRAELAGWKGGLPLELQVVNGNRVVASTLEPAAPAGDFLTADVPLEGEGAALRLLLPRQPYAFAARNERNRFFFFAGTVLAAGFFLTFLFSAFQRGSAAGTGVPEEDWRRLLSEIETLKGVQR